MNTTPHNPYAQAAGAYGTNAQKHGTDQRELEARVLLKAARMLVELQENWGDVTTDLLDSTLKYNRQIWMMFYDTAIENTEGNRPNDLRSNIINLANFVFKREVEIMADKERSADKLNVLININKEIAAGLMTNTKTRAGDTQDTQQENNADSEKSVDSAPITTTGAITSA